MADVTKQMGIIYYLCEFDGGQRFYNAKEAKNLWPNLIIDYLEPLIEIQWDSKWNKWIKNVICEKNIKYFVNMDIFRNKTNIFNFIVYLIISLNISTETQKLHAWSQQYFYICQKSSSFFRLLNKANSDNLASLFWLLIKDDAIVVIFAHVEARIQSTQFFYLWQPGCKCVPPTEHSVFDRSNTGENLFWNSIQFIAPNEMMFWKTKWAHKIIHFHFYVYWSWSKGECFWYDFIELLSEINPFTRNFIINITLKIVWRTEIFALNWRRHYSIEIIKQHSKRS